MLARAEAAGAGGRTAEALALYREVLSIRPGHEAALRGVRDLSLDAHRHEDAIAAQQQLLARAAAGDRARESEWLAALHYERGRQDLEQGHPAAAVSHLRNALRADRRFLPAVLVLGDALVRAGDRREAVRIWERAVESQSGLPLLERLERAYREEGRPARMIALYREAAQRAPQDVALALALGRVYLELEMLDEAADQFEKAEVQAPDSPVVHAYLGAVFERRGETREALEEYRRALRLAHAFAWPQRCQACGGVATEWAARCPQCHRWNTLLPSLT